jgi:hypothetical protein
VVCISAGDSSTRSAWASSVRTPPSQLYATLNTTLKIVGVLRGWSVPVAVMARGNPSAPPCSSLWQVAHAMAL